MWLVPILVLGVSACEKDRGPGTLELEVSAAVPLGAVLLELRGKGIEGVDPISGGWIEGHPFTDAGGAEGYRIVAVLQAPGGFRIGVRVADLDDRLPRVDVVEASGAYDQPVQPVGSVEAKIRR